jgi:superfamily II DNA or RNA helicase
VESDLARAVAVPERNALVVKAYQELTAGRRAIVFCVDVAHAQALAGAFRERGVRAGAVWGAMGPGPRRDALRAFGEGRLDVLTNCNVLTEGFDEPRVDCVLMARPTQSELLYAQMVGRGTRLHQDKSDLVVVDVVDNSRRHRLAGLNALFDLPDTLDLRGISWAGGSSPSSRGSSPPCRTSRSRGARWRTRSSRWTASCGGRGGRRC